LSAEGGKKIWIVLPLPIAEVAGDVEVVAGLDQRLEFDDLVPSWLFPSRPFVARVLIGIGVPLAMWPLLSWFAARYDARPGPFVALLMMFAAATAGWPGALLGGLGLTAEYWYFSATPVHTFARPAGGSGVGIVGLLLIMIGLIALTVRIEQVVVRMRALDRERRDAVESQADLRRRAERTASQAEAVLAIGTVLAEARTVADVAEAALNELNIPAAPNFASVAMVEGNHLHVIAARGATPELIGALEAVDLRKSPWLGGVLDGEPVYVEDRQDFAARYPSSLVLELYSSGSWLVVPFRTDTSLGLVSLHYADPQPLRDYRLYFSLVSELLGNSLERARSEDQQRRAHRELELAFAERDRIARTLSTTVLPPALPRLAGFAAAAWLLPASGDELAGDFYDLFAVDDGWVGVLGDVCGKGAEAAAVTSLARYAARTAALENPDPAHIARVANQALDAEPSDLFCTAVIVRYLRGSGEVEVTLAGHLQARMVCDGEVHRLGQYGAALGLGASTPQVDRYNLPPGAMVVLFSDGLVERDPAFGEADLDAFLAQAKGRNAAELSGDMRALVTRLSPRHPDDVAVLVLERSA
jgi:sigma-B regulation protein RsbU (phosphoserine phosphatase)